MPMFAQVDSVEMMMKYLNNGLAIVLLIFGCVLVVQVIRWIGTNVVLPVKDKILKTLENTDTHLESASKSMDNACVTMERICEDTKSIKSDISEIKPMVSHIHDRTKAKGNTD